MKSKKLIAVFIVIAMILTLTVPAFAAETAANTPKEEVVYINLNADGSVNKIYAVNIFELNEDGQIVDYGDYTALRNMTSNDEIKFEDETVRIDTKAGKLYYEGVLSGNAIPWIFSFRYYMDGTECTAAETAGKNGAFRLAASVKQNPDCDSTFFDHYTLQLSVTLDTALCKNITASGATAANVGGDRQLAYMILPGNEKDFEITADVTDFKMDGIAVNGIPMAIDVNLDLDNNAEFNEKFDELKDAIAKLDDGATELKDGSSTLLGGANDLKNGISDLKDGADELVSGASLLKGGTTELYNGVAELKGHMAELSGGLSELSSQSADLNNGAYAVFTELCATAQVQLNTQLTANGMQTVTLTPENYSTVLLGILSALDADSVYTQAYNVALSEVTSQVEAQADVLYAGYIDSIADSVYSQYIHTSADSIYLQYINNLSDAEKAQIYQQAAASVVMQQLMLGGMNETEAQDYLSTTDGQALVTTAVGNMTSEDKQNALTAAAQSLSDTQKEQILAGALAALTPEQKSQIRAGAVASLTEEQKAQIKDAYIEQMMASDEVTEAINAQVAKANTAATQISGLKGQLDSYQSFYSGLSKYTSGVDEAAGGAADLYIGTTKLLSGASDLEDGAYDLYNGAAQLRDGVITLADGAMEFYDGTAELCDGIVELKNGTVEFKDKTANLKEDLKDKITETIDDMLGGDFTLESFVSDKNENVESVQFVIKTSAIETAQAVTPEPQAEAKPNFWQKLLRLFGIK